MSDREPLNPAQEAELAAWLRGLRGQAAESGLGKSAHSEGQCLQRALSATVAEQPALSPRELEVLLAQAEHEGLFRASGCRLCQAWREALRSVWQAPAWRWGGAFSGALALSLLVWLGLPTQSPWSAEDGAPAAASGGVAGGETGGAMRGSDGVLQLRVPDPQAWRESLATDLQAQGLELRRYERLGRLGLDVELSGLRAERQPAVQAILKRRGIPWPADGVLMLELSAGPAPTQP